MFKCEIIADSLNPQGDRLTTFVLQFPRIVLAEFNTHRMFSRNSASSRAIPFSKMVKEVQENPFIPIAWQKNHRGMQGTEYLDSNKKYVWSDISLKLEQSFYKTFDDSDITLEEVVEIKELMKSYVWVLFKDSEGMTLSEWWLKTRDLVIAASLLSYAMGVTKQLCNRLLEPFMWHKVIMTTSEEGLQNFFDLRCPQYNTPTGVYKSKKDSGKYSEYGETPKYLDSIEWFKINESQADIHIQAIAELMWDSYNESTLKQLQAGEWHTPFGNNIDWSRFSNLENIKGLRPSEVAIKIATARCARISYNNFEGKDDYEADIDLFNSLVQRPYTNSKGTEFDEDDPIHASPSEHCAVAMSDKEYESYYRGKLDFIWLQDSDSEFEGEFYEPDITDKYSKQYHGWCRNFKGFIQLREVLD